MAWTATISTPSTAISSRWLRDSRGLPIGCSMATGRSWRRRSRSAGTAGRGHPAGAAALQARPMTGGSAGSPQGCRGRADAAPHAPDTEPACRLHTERFVEGGAFRSVARLPCRRPVAVDEVGPWLCVPEFPRVCPCRGTSFYLSAGCPLYLSGGTSGSARGQEQDRADQAGGDRLASQAPQQDRDATDEDGHDNQPADHAREQVGEERRAVRPVAVRRAGPAAGRVAQETPLGRSTSRAA